MGASRRPISTPATSSPYPSRASAPSARRWWRRIEGGSPRRRALEFDAVAVGVLDVEGRAVAVGTVAGLELPHLDAVGREMSADGGLVMSFSVYNTKEDVDRLIEGVKKVQQVFQ